MIGVCVTCYVQGRADILTLYRFMQQNLDTAYISVSVLTEADAQPVLAPHHRTENSPCN